MNLLKNALEKYRSMGAPAKAAAWYTVCNILQKGISFIVVPIYVRVLTTAEYGQYTVFQSWREIIVILATLNLYCGVFTKAMVDYPHDRYRYTTSMQTLSTLITAALFLVYLTARDFWNHCLDMNTTTVLMMFAYFVFYPAVQFWSVHQRVAYRYRRMVAVTLLISVLTPAVSIALLNITSLRAEAVIYGSMLVQIVVGAYFYVWHYFKAKCIGNKEYCIAALKFNIPLLPHYLSLIALSQVDRIMVKQMSGEDKAGIYSFTLSISQLMNIFVNAINSAIVPWIYENIRNKQYSAVAKVANGLCLLVGILTMGVILVSPEVVKIMGTQDYMEAIWIIPPLSLSIFYTFCYGMFSNVEFYFSATKYVMIASAAAAVLKIALNWLCIPQFGYLAAGYTTLLCYIMLMVLHYYFMRRVCWKEIDGAAVYDIKTMLLLCIAMMVLMLVCLLLYNYTLLRYALILVALVMVFVFRNKIIQFIKQVI